MTDKIETTVKPIPEEDGGGYVAYAQELEGCMSDGETQSEALDNLHDAISEWLYEANRLRGTHNV